MALSRTPVALVVAGLVLVPGYGSLSSQTASEVGPTESVEWQSRGISLGYNLDRDESIDAFRKATLADPTSSNAYRLLAAAAWTALLYDHGAIMAEDYLGSATDSVWRQPPNPALATLFTTSLDRALVLAEQAVIARPNDRDMHFQVGAAYGLRAAYTATVEGKVIGSFGAARRAYREHQALLARDPSGKDAGLIVGLYRYTVSTLSAPRRLGAYLAGFSGGREEGLRLVEGAATYPSDAQPQARFMLVLLYNREGRYDDALRVIRELQAAYPKNRLLWLEEGSTMLRAGRFQAARTALETGLHKFQHDPRPKALGEEARWRHAYGAALVGVGDTSAARRELTDALPLAARDWVRGRIHLELGKAADRTGNHAHAITDYREAERLCRLDRDTSCGDTARTLSRKGYRP